MRQLALRDVQAHISAREARLKEMEKRLQDIEGEARSLRTHFEHDKKVLDAWKAHAAQLKEIGEFH